jgi:hypothetical protein
MKRFVAIVTIAVLVLAMSAGSAFAYSCVGNACCSIPATAPGSASACAPAASAACPMDAGTVMQHSACVRGDAGRPLGATSVQTPDEVPAVCVAAVSVPRSHALGALPASAFAPDARGAPHLTSVLRI